MTGPDLTGLRIHTAHTSYAGPGRVDITLRSRHQTGTAFAARWEIVEPFQATVARSKILWGSAVEDAGLAIEAKRDDSAEVSSAIRAAAAENIELLLGAAWETYAIAYEAGLDRGKGIRMDAWAELALWASEGRTIVGVCDCAGRQIERRQRYH